MQDSIEGLLEEFDIYLERRELTRELKPKLTALSESLKKLFADRPQIALREKVASVTSGVVPEAIDFHSICDLRPIFNEERDAIVEYTTVALVRILLRGGAQRDSSIVFQIDSQGATQMEKFLARLQKKMAVLETVRTALVGRKK